MRAVTKMPKSRSANRELDVLVLLPTGGAIIDEYIDGSLTLANLGQSY